MNDNWQLNSLETVSLIRNVVDKRQSRVTICGLVDNQCAEDLKQKALSRGMSVLFNINDFDRVSFLQIVETAISDSYLLIWNVEKSAIILRI